MKYIVFSDPHITDSSIQELEEIFTEISSTGGDSLICLGDYYDKLKPSPKEILFGTEWAYKFKQKFNQVVFIKGNLGNHGNCGEFTNLDYLQFLGITLLDTYTLENKVHFIHAMANKSKTCYDIFHIKVSDLIPYTYTLIGHQHMFQDIEANIVHLGSCRWVNMGEACDKEKYIATIENDKVSFIPLKTPIKIIEVNNVLDLNTIPNRTKIYYKINSFEQLKDEINMLDKIKTNFYEFRIKLNFTEKPVQTNTVSTSKPKVSNILSNWLNNIEDEDVKKELKEEFTKYTLC